MRALRLHRGNDPYPVLLGRGLVAEIGPRLARLFPGRRVAILTHRKLDRLFGRQLSGSLKVGRVRAERVFMPEGERYKNLDTVERLYDVLIRRRLGREDALVAFGGGVVGDTAGFVAATYLRGIAYVQVPTTLLAQIDSAIGAKVGVNHPQGKNLIGAIWRPAAVWIDPALLTTLPDRQVRSGLFELLKYGFIGAPSLFRQMERWPDRFTVRSRALERAIAVAVRMKLSVARRDEREGGLRRILNFGHTVGHGLEAAGDYRKLSHGEAVGWGMIAASRLAYSRGLLSAAVAERMERAVRALAELPSLGALDPERALRAIDRDKKRGPRGLRMVLPTGLGRVTMVEGIPREALRELIRGLGAGRGG